jgi:hypothetical protein
LPPTPANATGREELTLSKGDHHAEAVHELDVEGILAFAEHILPRASDMWVQSLLDYKQLFFPEGIAFDGNQFSRTAVTAPLFRYLAPGDKAEENLASPAGVVPEWTRETTGEVPAASGAGKAA